MKRLFFMPKFRNEGRELQIRAPTQINKKPIVRPKKSEVKK